MFRSSHSREARKHQHKQPPIIEPLESRQLMSVATTTLFSDDFDHGNKGWTNDTYLTIDSRPAWTVGTGMTGVGTHSGTNCASTTLAGTDCYFATPAINMPAVNQYTDHEYLKFWTSTQYSSFGLPSVEVREMTNVGWGPWNIIEPNAGPLPQNSSGWHYVGYDATLFAGKQVQFGFHQYGSGKWAIDDVSVTEEHIPKGWPGNESFTNGFDSWYTGSGMWDVGNGYAGTAVHSPTQVGEGILWSPGFYMPNAGKVTLSFKSWTSNPNAGLMNVVYEYWWPSTGWSPYYVQGSPIYATKANAWQSISVDLSGTVGGAQIVPIRVGFYYNNTGLASGANWFVTGVQLTASGTAQTPIALNFGAGNGSSDTTDDPHHHKKTARRPHKPIIKTLPKHGRAGVALPTPSPE